MELTRLVNLVLIFIFQKTLPRQLTFPLWSLTVTLTDLLFGFISSDPSICSTATFFSLGISDHVVVSVRGTSSHSLWLFSLFYFKLKDSHVDWDGLYDHLNVPWKNIFKLGASAAVTKFREWGHVAIDVYISYRKYQDKLHSFPWFSAACTAAMAHRNYFFRLYQQNTSHASWWKFKQISNPCERAFEAAQLKEIKQKNLSLFRNLTHATFDKLWLLNLVHLLCLMNKIDCWKLF